MKLDTRGNTEHYTFPDIGSTGKGWKVKEYVRCCRRRTVSKPEPEGRILLESVKTSRPLDLVYMDFWSAEDQ